MVFAYLGYKVDVVHVNKAIIYQKLMNVLRNQLIANN